LDTGRIIFLYRVEPGHANRSYGLEVAELAGIPAEVLKIAHAHLNHIQNQAHPMIQTQSIVQVKPLSPILRELAQLDPDRLTAREALDLIYRFKNMETADN
jgi:DNA mismatch repair protein MutS